MEEGDSDTSSIASKVVNNIHTHYPQKHFHKMQLNNTIHHMIDKLFKQERKPKNFIIFG
jgi:hypothetical protein